MQQPKQNHMTVLIWVPVSEVIHGNIQTYSLTQPVATEINHVQVQVDVDTFTQIVDNI